MNETTYCGNCGTPHTYDTDAHYACPNPTCIEYMEWTDTYYVPPPERIELVDTSEFRFGTCGLCDKIITSADAYIDDAGNMWCNLGHYMDYTGDDDYDNDEDDLEILDENCGKNREGWCELVGTAYCDWQCPFPEVDREDDQ